MDVKAIFNEALEKNVDERAAYLDLVCARQPDLRARVEALLVAFDEADSFLEQKPNAQVSTVAEVTADYTHKELTSNIIAGKYKIREKLGEGGMGSVYVVETFHDVKAFFALKLIKPGYDSRSVLARFEQERQALALMNHPNIARFVDAGATETGQPFFVMELIKGMPITEFCDHEKLTVEQRIELFKPICQAVQHAHQKGIIHRDLKPSNILVALYDGLPIPKVIDFGVAKATMQPLTDKSIYSEVKSVIGTLEYMSPEQAEVNSLDIDTRADIYSLGVILYELLTGMVPFSRNELKAAGFLRMLEIIRDEEPAKPSTKISSSGSLPTVAATRKIEPRALTRKLQGELDWIVMKCLSKERNRRYEGPNQLAQDLDNYLTNLPVLAGPPSTGYRVKKFLKRHRGKVIAAAVMVLSLVGGIIGTSWGMVKAVRAETAAEREAEAARAINQFLEIGILKQADPRMQIESGLLVDQEIKLKDAVKRAGKLLLDGQLSDQPKVKASLHQAIGRTLLTLGDIEQAHFQMEKADELWLQEVGEKDLNRLTNRLDLGKAKLALGKENAQAEKLIQETVTVLDQRLPAHNPLLLKSKRQLAEAYQQQTKIEESTKLWQEIVATCQKYYGEEHLQTAIAQAGLAQSSGLLAAKHQSKDLYPEADRLYEVSTNALKRLLGTQHPDYLDLMNSYGVYTARKGELTRAASIYQEQLERYKAVVDADHNSVLITKQNLATVYFRQGRKADAVKQLKEVVERYLHRYGPEYDGALAARVGLASIQFSEENYADAEEQFRSALQIMERKKGPRHHDANRYANSLAETLFRENKLEEAEKFFVRVLETNSLVQPVSEVNLFENRMAVIKTRLKLGKIQACQELLEQNEKSTAYQTMPTWRKAFFHMLFADYWLAAGQKEKAEAAVNKSLELYQQDKVEKPVEYQPGKDRAKALENLEAIRRKL